jgi:ABC-type antimicrobial peptide transport system permease subunit
MALGAEPTSVVRMVLKQVLGLVAVGIATGILLAVSLSQTMRKLLFELSPTDPVTICGVAALLSVVALLAGYLPARRATRIDPLESLRAE